MVLEVVVEDFDFGIYYLIADFGIYYLVVLVGRNLGKLVEDNNFLEKGRLTI